MSPAIHLAFEHFETVNLALDRTGAPGQSQPGFHRFVVVSQTIGKPLKCDEAARYRSLQPGIEALRLALTHELSKTLSQINGFG